MLTISADAAMAAVNSHFIAKDATLADVLRWYEQGKTVIPFSGDELAKCKNEGCH